MKIGFLSHVDINLYLFRLPIMQRLVQKGWKVYAIAPKGRYWEKFGKFGIIPIDYQIDRKSLHPVKEFQSIQSIYRVLKPLQLDIIHTFTAKPNIYGTFAAKLARVPKIVNLVEGLGSYYIEDNNIKNRAVRTIIELLYKIAFKLSDKVIFVNSDDPKYMLQNKIITFDKVEVIKSVGIDVEYYNPAKVNFIKFSTHKPVVMMVGRAIWHKGVKEFYEAANRLKHKAHFVYIGSPDPGNPSSVNEDFLYKGCVEYLGHRDDIRDLIGSCDIFVLPTSYREGLPRTLLEAGALGKPLVATNTVGCRDVVIDGVNGFLVPVKDIESLSKAIEKLIDNQDMRKQFGQNSRKIIEMNFSIEKIISQYEAIYEKLL